MQRLNLFFLKRLIFILYFFIFKRGCGEIFKYIHKCIIFEININVVIIKTEYKTNTLKILVISNIIISPKRPTVIYGIKSSFRRLNMSINQFINSVVEGDCLNIMKNIPDKSIDMILCDLPYGTTQNKWDSVIPLDRLWEQYERIIKENGAIILTSQGIFTAKLILSNEKLFKYKIVWIKSKPTNFLNAKIQPLRKHEDICIFYKKQPIYNPQMMNGEPYDKGIRNKLTLNLHTNS